jgi:hypothetical protein
MVARGNVLLKYCFAAGRLFSCRLEPDRTQYPVQIPADPRFSGAPSSTRPPASRAQFILAQLPIAFTANIWYHGTAWEKNRV